MSQAYYVAPLLFDRIVQDEPVEAVGQQGLSSMLASIQRELQDLLNTRVTARRVFLRDGDQEELFTYAIPFFTGMIDSTAFDASNPYDWPKVEQYLTLCIETFEPRLRRIVPKIMGFKAHTQDLEVSVYGVLILNKQETPVTFSLVYTPKR